MVGPNQGNGWAESRQYKARATKPDKQTLTQHQAQDYLSNITHYYQLSYDCHITLDHMIH